MRWSQDDFIQVVILFEAQDKPNRNIFAVADISMSIRR